MEAMTCGRRLAALFDVQEAKTSSRANARVAFNGKRLQREIIVVTANKDGRTDTNANRG